MANPNPVGKWKKGQSGNPNGRPPKDYSLSEILIKKLKQKGRNDKEEREILIEKLLELAHGGDLQAIKYIYDRLEGKPSESIKHEGELDGNVQLIISDKFLPDVDDAE